MGNCFCPPVVPRSGTGDGKRFRNSALAPKRCEATTGQAEYQNRKIFLSLIEKIFCAGAIKKIFRKFICFSRRSEEQADGNVPKESIASYGINWAGLFKKVRISSKRHAS